MKTRWIVFFALLFFALALLALAPASLIDARLRAASGDRLRIDEAQGTVWRGRGRLLAVLPEGPVVLVERLSWQLEFSALLRATLAFSLKVSEAAPPARFALSTPALEINELRLRIPAAALALAPALAASQPSGELAIELTQLEWRDEASRGQGHIVWERARLAPSGGPVRDLGRLVFELRGEGGKVTLESTRESAARVRIELARHPGRGIEWQGQFNP